MPTKSDYAILIGRFQILHQNHVEIIENALFNAKKVIILLGSANRPRSIKNPFTVDERIEMIRGSVCYPENVIFAGINDYTYNDQRWALNVQSTVDRLIEADGKNPDEVKICITGNKGDFTSYYIDLFPQWEYLPIGNLNPEIKHVHSSDLRNMLFSDSNNWMNEFVKYVPVHVFNFISNFKSTHFMYPTLKREYEYIEKYKKAWEAAPYAPTFVTVDSIVIQSGHVLLVKRRAEPGKGLWAMPGGFLDQKERIEDAMLRELHEETKIKVPVPVLRGNIKKRGVYDAVERSLRGRTITHVFMIELPAGPLPRVKGSDDAEKAVWVPISELKSEDMFEDHFDVITDMLGI